MKHRYHFIILGIIIVIGIISIIGYVKLGPVNRVNHNIPSDFLYHSKSDKISEEYLLADNQILNTDLIYQENDKFYCKDSGKEAEKIEYFYHSPGFHSYGGWYYRFAYVCGGFYWVLDADDGFGTKIYGPFKN